MKEKIKNLLQSVAKDVIVKQESSVLERCEFWLDCDFIPFAILQYIETLSQDISLGVVGFNNGQYYITVYGISAKS